MDSAGGATLDSQRMNRVVSFRRMQDGTREDYLLLEESERRYFGPRPASEHGHDFPLW